MYKLGIGIEILDYNKADGWVKMKGGVSLQKIISGKSNLFIPI